MTTPDPREPLGRLVRQVWVNWAREQPDAKPSWTVPWEDLDDGQREVDMRIGEAIAVEARAVERERIRQLAIDRDAFYPVDRRDDYDGEYVGSEPFADLLEDDS